MKRSIITVDGNEGVALVAHKVNEVIAIYPITPSSSMGEFADACPIGEKNIWGLSHWSWRCNQKVVQQAQCMGLYKPAH
jgi:pyruvate/2-oxoacid:ferredoxin oxidoreductase alpha subunit